MRFVAFYQKTEGVSVVYKFIKRVSDILFSILLLIVLSPLLGGIMLVLTVTTRGKPIFKQQRAGRLNRPFYMYKFRTMHHDAPPHRPTADFEDANRYITRFGHFLRNTSFDELPQLWNVLKGDMSFIGPRPVILAEVTLLRERQKRGADTVRPGLSGISQLHGRDFLDVAHKARYDAYYAAHYSFWLDVRLFFRTIYYVATRRGVKLPKS